MHFHRFPTVLGITIKLYTAVELFEFERMIYTHTEYETDYEEYLRHHDMQDHVSECRTKSFSETGVMIYELKITGTDWQRFQEIQQLLINWIDNHDEILAEKERIREEEHQRWLAAYRGTSC